MHLKNFVSLHQIHDVAAIRSIALESKKFEYLA